MSIYKFQSIIYSIVIKMSPRPYRTIENYLSNPSSDNSNSDSRVITMAKDKDQTGVSYLSEADKKKIKEEASLIKKLFKDSFYDALKGTKHYKTRSISGKAVPVGITIDNEADVDKALNGAAETVLNILYHNSTDEELQKLKEIYRKNPHMYEPLLVSVGIDKHQLKEQILRHGEDADELEAILDGSAENASGHHLIESAIKKVRQKVPLKESQKLGEHTKKLYGLKGYELDPTGRSHEEMIRHYTYAALGLEAGEAQKFAYIKKKKVKEEEMYKKAA